MIHYCTQPFAITTQKGAQLRNATHNQNHYCFGGKNQETHSKCYSFEIMYNNSTLLYIWVKKIPGVAFRKWYIYRRGNLSLCFNLYEQKQFVINIQRYFNE